MDLLKNNQDHQQTVNTVFKQNIKFPKIPSSLNTLEIIKSNIQCKKVKKSTSVFTSIHIIETKKWIKSWKWKRR